MSKALVISYYWPPAGGVEVHRVAKFCKYLTRLGWNIDVLTVRDSGHGQKDPGLLDDVSGVRRTLRSASLEPHVLFRALTGGSGQSTPASGAAPSRRQRLLGLLGEYVRLNVFIPDARIGWLPFARHLGRHAVEENRPDVIFSTAPPYTVHLVARSLAQRYRIPWVADFRDPWVENYAYNTVPRLPWVKAINAAMERSILRQADAVLCATPRQLALQSGKIEEPLREKFHLITNGYDTPPPERMERTDRFCLAYFGTLSAQRLPPGLLPALQALVRENTDFARSFLLRVIGRYPAEVAQRIRAALPEHNLDLRGHIPQAELAPLQRQEQAMLVLVDAVPRNELIIPAKMFEILPTGNPMLVVGPSDGDAARLLASQQAGVACVPNDEAGLRSALAGLFAQWQAGALNRGPRRYPEFERETLAGQLDLILRNLATMPARPRP